MPRVLIVEDEPAAGRYLKALVEADPSGFSVAAVAENGEQALELLGEPGPGPDLVLTDVRMPLLDGLGLASRLRREFPRLPVVIVSGHQEFEYARQALALGVVDYLLKPVDPQALALVLSPLKDRIQAQGDLEVLEAVGTLLAGHPAPGVRYPERFLVALVRWGGPLTRATPLATGGSALEPGFWAFPGRDPEESLFLADAQSVRRDAFEGRIRGLPPLEGRKTQTQLFAEKPVVAGELVATVRSLGPQVDRLLVPGHIRSHWGPVQETPLPALDPVWIQRVKLGLQQSAHHKLEALIRGKLGEWAHQGRPARQVMTLVRQLLLLAHHEAPGDSGPDWELSLEEGWGEVDSYDDLTDHAWGLFTAVAGLGGAPSATDAPEVHQRILRFLQTHYAEAISIPVVCERFQTSQTSLSKQFRRYEGCTFHEYLTRLRLDAADRLLSESPELPLKTVASCVGYQDPFHFSRAFKAAKGRSPSQRG